MKSRWIAFVALAAVGCGLDLWTKHVMFTAPELQRGGVSWLVEGYAGYQLSLNEGALFGIGQGAQFWFALLSVLAAAAIPVWLFAFGAARDWWMTITLGGVMGGVLGNLYDRANLHRMVWGVDWPAPSERHGEPIYAVRDWVLLQLGDELRWPNFNIADALLVVGAAVLFLRALRAPADTDGSSDPAA
ncbi:MAG: signal peptidase II [Planctomycetota bacterium]